MRPVLFFVALAACGSEKKPELPTTGSSAPVVHDAAVPGDAATLAIVDAAPADGPRPEHVAYDLVDNRHAAHRTVNGDLVLDAGDIGFAKYTRFGATHWKLGQTIGGKRMAVPDAIAGIQVPLTVEQARTSNQLALQVTAAVDVTLSIKTNGGKAGKAWRTTLSAGTNIVGFDIDPKRLVVGENEIAFEWKAKGKAKKGEALAAVEWIRIGAKHTVVPAGPGLNASAGSSAPVGLSLTPTDPRGAATFDKGQHAILLDKDATLTYFVQLPDGANLVADVAAPCTVDVRARPSADAFAGGVLDAQRNRVDLTQMAGRTVALTLTAHDCDRATITRPRITLHGADAVRLPTAPPPKYVVLWEMDGVRADSLPTFTPRGAASTPTIDELAKTSTVFRQAYSRGQQSLVAGDKVPDFAAIAKPMQDAGYTAAAVTGAGTSLVDEAIKQMDALRAKPTYLVVAATHTLVCPTPPLDLTEVRALYDAGLAAPDEDLGRFIKQLRAWGIWDQTMLVVTSNHGEELYEAGACGFGRSLRDAVVHVPLLIHDPSRFPAVSVDEGAQASAVFPAMLAAATGHDAPLIALAQGLGRGWARPSFAENGPLRVMRIGEWTFSLDEVNIPWLRRVRGGPFDGPAEDVDKWPIERRMLTDNLGLYLAAKTALDASDAGVVTQVTPAGAEALDAASAD